MGASLDAIAAYYHSYLLDPRTVEEWCRLVEEVGLQCVVVRLNVLLSFMIFDDFCINTCMVLSGGE